MACTDHRRLTADRHSGAGRNPRTLDSGLGHSDDMKVAVSIADFPHEDVPIADQEVPEIKDSQREELDRRLVAYEASHERGSTW